LFINIFFYIDEIKHKYKTIINKCDILYIMVTYQCQKCGKEFPKKGDYTRHVNRKTLCVKKVNITKNDKMIKMLGELNKEVSELNKEVSELNKEVKELRDEIATNSKMIDNNSKNTSNTIIVNNGPTTINIIAHGDENLYKLIPNQMANMLLRNPMNGLGDILRYVYFNKDRPEMQHVGVTNDGEDRENINL
jgi:uncharacterized C2H2 Zn-finger protein